MKIKILTVVGVLATVGIMTAACANYDVIDTTYSYNRAMIELSNGEVVEGTVEKWRDYEDGDQIQVKIDGITYLVHSSNVTLIHE